MNMYKWLITILLVVIYPGLATAVPMVSKVEWVGSKTLRITGSSFGVKVPAAPQYWADFEGTTAPSSLGVQTTWPALTGLNTNSVRGSKVTGILRADISENSSGKGPRITNFNHDKFYINFKRYYDFNIVDEQGPVGFNLKFNRLWGEKTGGTAPYGNNLYMAYQGQEGLKTGRAFNEYTSTEGASWFGPTHPFQPKTWQTEQIIYKTSDVNVKNGVFYYVRNGVHILDKNRLWQTRDSTRPNRYNIIVFDQVSNGTAPGPLYIYYDNVYIDNTWARVMLCESASWDTCMQQEIQIPVAWTDNQVDVQINLGDLDLKSSIYVYVIDANGDANPAGKILPSFAVVPSPPTSVNIVSTSN